MLKKPKNIINGIGVYIFRSRKGTPLYIGRSINLKERVGSYFSSADIKTAELIQEAAGLSFLKTKNLIEAVVKEAELIKKHKPKYNIKEKDDRSFMHIIVSRGDWGYPRVVRGRILEKEKKESRFVSGPFKSLRIAGDVLRLLRKVFPYSTCDFNNLKPCFHYTIGLCPGKCTGEINAKHHKKNVDNLILFLKGEKEKVINFLKKSSPEKAKLLSAIDDSILITRGENFSEGWNDIKIEGYDITHFGGKEAAGSMVSFEKGAFNKNGYRIFKIKGENTNDDISSLKEVLKRRLKHSEWSYPDLILVDGGRGQVNAMEKALSEERVEIPVVGISKYGGDKIIYGKIGKEKVLSADFIECLKSIRDEAHRFGNSFRKRNFKKTLKL